MERIEWLPGNEGLQMRFLYVGATEQEAIQLRRAMMTQIPCHAIHTVNFFTKANHYPPASMSPESISHRLGLLPLRQYNGILTGKNSTVYTLVVSGNPNSIRKVLSSDIKDPYGKPLDVAGEFEIAQLKGGEHITCDIRINPGMAKDHVKYSVISTPGYEVHPRGYAFSCELVGQYEAEEALYLAFTGLYGVSALPAENGFYKAED
jgi:hypothetical protein